MYDDLKSNRRKIIENFREIVNKACVEQTFFSFFSSFDIRLRYIKANQSLVHHHSILYFLQNIDRFFRRFQNFFCFVIMAHLSRDNLVNKHRSIHLNFLHDQFIFSATRIIINSHRLISVITDKFHLNINSVCLIDRFQRIQR